MKKLLALFLALALMASFAAVFAASETEPAVDSAPEAPIETESLVTEDLKKQIVPESEVPDLIDYSVAVEEKYVCRAYWEETDLNEVVFLKSDGTLARYYFAIPVKYEENGEVFDKKPALVERETLLNNLYRYELTTQNDTAFYCPDNLTHGFLYQGGGMEVALRPITQSEYDFLRGHMNAGDMVLPQNILPEGFDSQAVTGTAKSALSVTDEETTAARYVLSTEGESVNSAAAGQDILSAVPSYNGFQLQLNLAEGALTETVYFELDSDLLPVPTEGGLLLCDQKGNPVGILGDLLSESGVRNDIPWTVTESLSGTYLLSATLPRNGQTYTLSTTNFYDYLQDATIYSTNNGTYGQSANLWIGYYGSMGMERVLIRPNNWYFTASQYPSQVVQSASVVIRDITATAPEAGIEVRPFIGNAWEQNSATWSSVGGNNYGSVLDTKAVSSSIGWNEGYYYHFNITSLIQNWYTGAANWQRGMIFRWNADHLATSNMEKCFASTQYSNENYRPRLEITTVYLPTITEGVYRIKASTRDMYLTSANSIASGTDVSLQNRLADWEYHQLWRVHDMGNGYYSIRPMHYTPATLHYEDYDVTICRSGLYDEMTTILSPDTWLIQPCANGYQISCFGSGMALAYSLTGTSVSPLEIGTSAQTDPQYWLFEVAPDPCTVIFYNETTMQPENYPSATVYCGDNLGIGAFGYDVSISMAESIDPSSCSWWTGDSSIVSVTTYPLRIHVLNTGTTSLHVEWFDSSGADYRISVLLTCYPIEDGNNFIRNPASGKYVDIKEQQMANGTEIHQWDFHGHWTQEWEFVHQGNYYYTIRSTVSGTPYYLSVSNSTASPTVVLKSDANGITDDMLWYLSYATSGKMKIAPKVGRTQGYAMAVVQDSSDQSQNGLLVKKLSYSDDAIYTDEWNVFSPFSFNLNVMVDQGYTQRFPDYQTRIASYLQELKSFYWEEFYILVKYSDITVFTSLADECPSSYKEPCSCVDDDQCQNVPITGDPSSQEAYHHKNANNIMAKIDFPDKSIAYTMVFLGHKTCAREKTDPKDENSSIEHMENRAAGVCYSSVGIAYVAASNFTKGQSLNERKTFFHEVGHWFGVPDHYNLLESPSTQELNEEYRAQGIQFSSACIYGELKDTDAIISDNGGNCVICSGCRSFLTRDVPWEN